MEFSDDVAELNSRLGAMGMEGDSQPRYDEQIKKVRILFLSDVDIDSATRLSEHFVPKAPQFDACVVCGPFSAESDELEERKTREAEAVAVGDMSTTLAQLENIVCRVIYLPSEGDPRSAMNEQLHLTPNSINIHARELPLVDGLNISGLTELQDTLGEKTTEPVMDSGDDPADPDEFGTTTHEKSTGGDTINLLLGDLAKNKDDASIFLLNHKYMHTLNTFLFHKPEMIERAGLVLCVVPRSDEVTARLPAKLGRTNFLVPKSLRQGGHYSFADFEITEHGPWTLTGVESTKLPN